MSLLSSLANEQDMNDFDGTSIDDSFSFDREFSFDETDEAQTKNHSNENSLTSVNPVSIDILNFSRKNNQEKAHSTKINSNSKFYSEFLTLIEQTAKVPISRVKTTTMPEQPQTKTDEEKQLYDIKQSLLKHKSISKQIYLKNKGNFKYLISKQQTSRLFQYYFPSTKPEIIQLIFDEIQNDISSLLFNPYANYFCLKLFYYINPSSKASFIKSVCDKLIQLSTNKISTYSVQCVIENVNTFNEKVMILNAVYPYLNHLCFDVYGAHVIEKILSVFEYNLIQPIHKFICEHFVALATSSNGLCVIKKIIKNEYQKDQFHVIKNIIISNAMLLVQNAYGNYAIQTAFEIWDSYSCEEIMKVFYGNIIYLSIQKYASNVIEMCLRKSSNFFEQYMIEISSDNFKNLYCLLNNPFGNYVLKTSLQVGVSYYNKDCLNYLLLGISNNLWNIQNQKSMMKWNYILNCYVNCEHNLTIQ